MLSVLAVVMLSGSVMPYIANAMYDEVPSDEIINLDDYEVKTQGLVMSPEEFNNAFGGEPESRFMPFNLVSSELSMHNIIIDGSEISLDLALSPVSLFGTIVDVVYSAYVTRLNGNQNDLTINVVEHFEDGLINELTETFRIDNNESGTFTIGNYEIFVSTRGNDRIHEIRLESDGTRILPVRGTIYNGNREESAFVVETEGLINGYELILFEINTGPTESNLVLPNSLIEGLYDRPHAKIYFLCEDLQLHMFETELSESLMLLDSDNFELLENGDDLFWPLRFLDYEIISEEENDEEFIFCLGQIFNFFNFPLDTDTSDIELLLPYVEEYFYITYGKEIANVAEYLLPDMVEDWIDITAFGTNNQTTTLFGGWQTLTTTYGHNNVRHRVRAIYRWRATSTIRQQSSSWYGMLGSEQYAQVINRNTGAVISTLHNQGFWQLRRGRVSIGVGPDTTIGSGWINSRMVERRNLLGDRNIALGTNIAVDILVATSTLTGLGVAINAVRDVVRNANLSGTVSQGQANARSFASINNLRGAAYQMRDQFHLSSNSPWNVGTGRHVSNGHFIEFGANVISTTSSTSMLNRRGAFRWRFDFYYTQNLTNGSRRYTRYRGLSREVEFNYQVTR